MVKLHIDASEAESALEIARELKTSAEVATKALNDLADAADRAKAAMDAIRGGSMVGVGSDGPELIPEASGGTVRGHGGLMGERGPEIITTGNLAEALECLNRDGML